MRKVRLDIDALEVESFATDGWIGKGTVRGHGSEDGTFVSLYPNAVEGCAGDGGTRVPCGGGATCSCQPQTCAASCYVTACGNSCHATECFCSRWCTRRMP